MCLILNLSLEQFYNKATDVAISIEFISENCELWLINEHSKTFCIDCTVHTQHASVHSICRNILIIRFALRTEVIGEEIKFHGTYNSI